MKAHWENVYTSKPSDNVSWYQDYPTLSLEFIKNAGLPPQAAIIDVGAGASKLADYLIEAGYRDITLLDISEAALHVTRQRLSSAQVQIDWLVGDITTLPLQRQRYDVWHDRAVFHFLTEEDQKRRYIEQVKHALKPGGHVILATFAVDGPQQCSGLNTERYDAAALHALFGSPFTLISSVQETHITPWQGEQRFVYCHCIKRELSAPAADSAIP
ncbi:MAG: class I SAM-dependent methyltransferase [Pleurocapsa minor GSE-CHR-MK-17-07R]|nr:class I SAM-dependent methyltransferase [Pleurocapsa minor GSE-CHR-MK 17-07R]